ncbi:hypothetical protein GCM10009117_10760 [Gangjinia marincola]|uniref:Surface layer protein n=1 Tax=Gangjinia marincola TaxID=578463 RepID=A0ABN1MFK9_9FLAO
MNILKSIFLIALSVTLFFSCDTDDDQPDPVPAGDYTPGFLVSHEGTFSGVSGSTSFMSADLMNVQNEIYEAVNKDVVGNFQQSIGFRDNFAYLVVDNTNTITIVNRNTFKKVGEYTAEDHGISTPRYIAFDDDNAYVTNLGDAFTPTDDYLSVIPLDESEDVVTVPLAEGPEQLLVQNGFVYITHKAVFSSQGSELLSIYNIATGSVDELVVGQSPDEIYSDVNGDIWILCDGKFIYNDDFTQIIDVLPSRLVRLSGNSNSISQTYNFTDEVLVNYMAVEGDKIYYIKNGSFYAMLVNATDVPASSIAALETDAIYGLSVFDNQLFVSDAGTFSERGDIEIYDVNSGVLINELEVGMIPSKVYKN